VRGLTGFGAWIMLLIIATEDEEHETGRRQEISYLPLHTMDGWVKPAKVKDGEEVRPARKCFTSLLNGKTYDHAPDFAKVRWDGEDSSQPGWSYLSRHLIQELGEGIFKEIFAGEC